MLKTEKEKRICSEFRSYGDDGRVRCKLCPLRRGNGSYDFRCKANSHYDRKLKEWVPDGPSEELKKMIDEA